MTSTNWTNASTNSTGFTASTEYSTHYTDQITLALWDSSTDDWDASSYTSADYEYTWDGFLDKDLNDKILYTKSTDYSTDYTKETTSSTNWT